MEKYIFLEGGTGLRVGLAVTHMMCCMNMYQKNNYSMNDWNMIFETMDSGNEELTQITKMVSVTDNAVCEGTLKAIYPDVKFQDIRIPNEMLARRGMPVNAKIPLKQVVNTWYDNHLLLTPQQMEQDLLGGYYKDLCRGRFISGASFDTAVSKEETLVSGQKVGFQYISDKVANADGNGDIRVVFVSSAIGGEGRTNITSHPEKLIRLCMEKLEHRGYTRTNAETHIKNVLKIAVIMTGSVFSFPNKNSGKPADVRNLVIGTFKSYPESLAQKINIFYLLEHDHMTIQSERYSDSGAQAKHAHAIELVAVSMIHNFFDRTRGDLSGNYKTVIPYYSIPLSYRLPHNPNEKDETTWDTLKLFKSYKEAILSRIRFDEVLFHYIASQALSENIIVTELLRNMFHERNVNRISRYIQEIPYNTEKKIKEPIRKILEIERLWLNYMRDICLTGKDWSAGGDISAFKTHLDPITVNNIDNMLSENRLEINTFSLTTLQTETGFLRRGVTIEKAKNVNYTRGGHIPREITDILNDIYQNCKNIR